MYLYFKEDEMTEFLNKRGYTIMEVKTWKLASRNEEIFTGSAFADVKVKCAFNNDYPKDDKMDSYTWIQKYGIDVVFNRELKKTILGL